MKYQTFFPASLLLFVTLTAFVSCQDDKNEITVKTVSDGIELTCGEKNEMAKSDGEEFAPSLKLIYKDENTGEYKCRIPDNSADSTNQWIPGPKIYVKFRTCDNCIEMDESAIAGLVVGNVVATIVLGVAVYLIASKTQPAPTTSHKKSSDRQHLVSNEVSSRGASGNDHYQRLNLKGGQRDTYDVIANRR